MKRIVVLAAVLIAISTVSVNAAATTVPESLLLHITKQLLTLSAH